MGEPTAARNKKGPPQARARVFVGSSTEALDVAYAIQENLEHDAEVTVWPQGIFDLSRPAIASLVNELAKSDFGVFVFSPDDRIRLRKQAFKAIRDNVIFELGLFAARLGIDRTFIIIPDDAKDLHIPTDLTGVTPGKYDANRQDNNLQAALGPFCTKSGAPYVKLGPCAAAGRRCGAPAQPYAFVTSPFIRRYTAQERTALT